MVRGAVDVPVLSGACTMCRATFRSKLIPSAVRWYTGEANEDDEDDDDEDYDDEEGDDDDEDDDDEVRAALLSGILLHPHFLLQIIQLVA